MQKKNVKVVLAASYFDANRVHMATERVGAMPVIVPLNAEPGSAAPDYFGLIDLWLSELARAFSEIDS